MRRIKMGSPSDLLKVFKLLESQQSDFKSLNDFFIRAIDP